MKKLLILLPIALVFVVGQFLTSSVLAQAGATAEPSFSDVLARMAPMFLVVFLVFHFMIIKPQKKKDQDHATLISTLKVGENVITSSGMIGRVTMVSPEHVTLEIASGVKVKFLPSHISKKEGV